MCVSVVLYIFDCECAHFSAKYILSVLHYWLRFDTSCCNYHYIFNLSVCCFINIPSPPLHQIVLAESLMRKASMIVCHCSCILVDGGPMRYLTIIIIIIIINYFTAVKTEAFKVSRVVKCSLALNNVQ